MASKPVGTFEKVVDVLRRGEYASASVAQQLFEGQKPGGSPYDNIFSAAWGGLSGKNRVDYFDLTGDPVIGFALGVLLDPVTWIPYGGLTKLLKATRLPHAAIMAGRFAAKKSPALARAAKFSRTAFRMGFGGPMGELKVLSKFDDTVLAIRTFGAKAGFKSGIVDDAIRGLERGTTSIDDAAKALGATGDFKAALSKIDDFRQLGNILTETKGKELRGVFDSAEGLVREARAFAKLQKTDPEKAADILRLIEKSAPVKVDDVFRLPDEFYKTAKRLGISQGELDDIARGVTFPKVQTKIGKQGAFDLVAKDPKTGALKSLNATISTVDAPLAHEMGEFREVLKLAVDKMGPEYKGIYTAYTKVYDDLLQKVLQKNIQTREILINFVRETEVTHLGRFAKKSLPDMIATIDDILPGYRLTYAQQMDDAAKVYRAGLKKAGLPDEVIGGQMDAFNVAAKKMLKAKAEDIFGDTDAMSIFMDNARHLVRTHPEVGQAFGLMKKALGDMQKMRRTLGSIGEWERLAKLHKIKGGVFETNLAEILFQSQVKMKRGILYHDMMEKITKLMPDIVRTTDGGDEFVAITDKLIGKYFVRKDAADVFNYILKLNTGKGGAMSDMLRQWDKGTGVWKYWTLIPFGKFHTRNLLSEMVLNTNMGMWMTDPAYARAAKLWHDARIKRIPKAIKEYGDLIEARVIGGGFFSTEFGGRAHLLRHGVKNVPGIRGATQGMEHAGEFTEAVPRIAAYYYAQKKGAAWLAKKGFAGTGKTAAAKLDNASALLARKFHPKYDEFTRFEQSVMRRIFPFYSWSRFNLPMQLEMFAKNPKVFANIERARRGITMMRGGELPDEVTPEWIREGYAIGWSKKAGVRNYIIMRNWLPQVDIADVLSLDSARKKFTQMLHPVKTVGEIVWGYDTFRGRKIPSVPGAKKKLVGFDVPERAAHLLQPIRMFQEVNRFFWGRSDPYWDRFIFHLVGRKYEVNREQARKWLWYDINRAVSGKDGLKAGVRRARRNGDAGTVRRLEQKIRVLEAQMKRLK